MGSPIPLPGVDPVLELDTVVATESDHFLLFRFLQSQQTGVPTAVISRLQRWPLVYIGYALDLWQFRLVTQVLRTVGRRSGGAAAPFAIRDPRTALEELSWRELGARLISMDPNQFASRLLTEQVVASS
jgi:hypothetical protein